MQRKIKQNKKEKGNKKKLFKVKSKVSKKLCEQ